MIESIRDEALTRAGSLTYVDDPKGRAKLSLDGRFDFLHSAEIWDEIRRHVDSKRAGAIDIDMAAVEAIDGGTIALLVHLRDELAEKGVHAEFSGGPEHVRALVHLYKGDVAPVQREHRKAEGLLAQIGRATV